MIWISLATLQCYNSFMHLSKKPIGILGGTFDPIHIGHLRMALELYQALELESVHLIPTFRSNYREQALASPRQRFDMLKCAVKAEKALIADDREIRRGGITYTIDTLIEMRTEMPETPLCLLVGLDAFLGFASWNRFNEILNYAHIIIAHRPNYHLPAHGIVDELIHAYQQDEISFIHEHKAGAIMLRPITALDISASDIRKQIAMGRNPRYLLPDSVCDYINQHGIYK